MRSRTDAAKIERLMKELGRTSRGSGHVYFTGGITAVLFGWRETTIDLKLAPEPPGAFEALARLKDELDLNVEIAHRFAPQGQQGENVPLTSP